MKRLCLLTALLLSTPALPQGGVVTTLPGKFELARITAAVEAVDLKNRILVVKTPRAVSAIVVDKSVTNLGKIQPGQMVELEFYTNTATAVTDRYGEPVRTRYAPVSDGVVALRKVNTVTDIYAVYAETRTVLVRGPLGHFTEVQVTDAAVLHTLKPGTRIELDYIEGVAMAIRPVAKKK